MDKRAEILAELIDKRGSRRSFAEEIGIPPTTLQSMLTRGIGRASVDVVLKICKQLGISADDLEKLANGEAVQTAPEQDEDDWTVDELDAIRKFKEFIRSQRK